MYNYSYTPYQQQINPILQPQQYQSQQYQANNYGLSGRMVDDISNVGANEVSLDGSPSIFVKKDLSEIYIKRWNQNGLIDTACYKLFVPEIPKSTPNTSGFVIEDSIKALQDALTNIDEKLNKALAPTTQKAKSPARKEVEL